MQRWNSENGGEWEEIRRLGSGGQSEVFLVRSPSRVEARMGHLEAIKRLSGQVSNESRAQELSEAVLGYGREELPSELGALKIYKPRVPGAAAEAQALRRLQVEIDALADCRQGLLEMLDFNTLERWIVTKFYPNGTLENNLSRFTGDALLSLTVFRQLVETVAALHEDKERIIHRDIKPANVFLDADVTPILGDFGIALPPNPAQRITLTGESVGPWDYRPPWADMAGRLDDVGESFDVYMLGKLLWCMVSGRLKLPREYYRREDYDVTRQFPTDPHMHSINAILDKCLHDTPDKCLPSAAELLKVVDAHLQVMRRGGQLLREGVPRPCRVCGIGFYRPPEARIRAVALQSGGTAAPDMEYARSFRPNDTLYTEFLVCDQCGHIQLFKVM